MKSSGLPPFITATFASAELGFGGLGCGGVFVFARGFTDLDAREDWLKGARRDTLPAEAIKIKADANPFDPMYKEYLIMRRNPPSQICYGVTGSSNTKLFFASTKPPVFRETKA